MNLTHEDVKNRTPGMDLVIKAKEPERAEIARQIAEFEAKGGKITVLEPTCKAITDDKVHDFYMHKMPTNANNLKRGKE